MSPELSQFLRYWSLTFAVFLFFLYATLVAGLDVFDHLMETVQKRRPQLKAQGPLPDPNPLTGRTIAQTLGRGPGQRPDAKRQWLVDLMRQVANESGLGTLEIVVLEDSKEHPLVHFNDGKTLRSYRVDKTWVAEARAGNASRVDQIRDLISRYLAADFLGQQDRRPPRTTELAREAASKATPAVSASTPDVPPPSSDS